MNIAMIGASGLVGGLIGDRLDGHHLLSLARSVSARPRPQWEELVAPSASWPGLLERRSVDVAISALGTTWRKAGSWSAFEAVDRFAVTGFARAAQTAGARQMIVLSSVGADPGSSNPYLAIKGRMEADLQSISFSRLDLLRPGLLRGPRSSDRRLGERLGILVSPIVNLFLRGPLDRFAAIDAVLVASAAAALIGQPEPGTHIHDNLSIRRLARP